MEQFIVSARKYRPATWEQVIGQDAITETLQRSIDSGHLAQAYLFCGPRGVGKTTCARIFAKQINVSDNDEDNDYAFNIFELDAASHNSVDDIRNLIDQVRIPPQTGKYKVYIIDEVHMLSSNAFNAFLKTLEEPPKYAVFILATTEKHKILPTILSRCQIYDFHRITVADMVRQLTEIAEKEGVQFEEEALHIIANKADGAMRDALSIFDQLVSFTSGKLTAASVRESLNVLDRDFYFQFVTHFQNADISSSLLLFNQILEQGFDGQHFLAGLSGHIRDLMVARDARISHLLNCPETLRETYSNQASQCAGPWMVQALTLLQRADGQYKQSQNPRLLAEVTLMQLCSLSAEAEQKKK
jgi:DNA polymerase-3 subunit gamma/tau